MLLPLVPFTVWAGTAMAYDMIPRWGHASTFLSDPPALLIQGGKTDPTGGYSYATAPNSADLILLPLDTPWGASGPPYVLLGTPTPGPAYAWHALSPVGGEGEVLVFGGDGGPGLASPSGNDSAWTLALGPIAAGGSGGGVINGTWIEEPMGWDNEPTRRKYLGGASGNNTAWITGGESPDGAGIVYPDTYRFSPEHGWITAAPLPTGLFHHASVMLPNGTLIVLGGAFLSPDTGNAALAPMNQVFALDTTSPGATWSTVPIGGSPPAGRRGASAAPVGNNTIWVFGGADADLNTVLGDAWVLDLTSLSWGAMASPGGVGPSARYDHSAVVGPSGQIVLFGGYGANGPADSGTYIFDPSSNAWVTAYSPTPPSSPPAVSTTSIASATSGSATATGTHTNSNSPSLSQTNSSPQPTAAPSVSGAHPVLPDLNNALSVPAQVAIILSSLALLGTLVFALLYLCRRNRQKRTFEAAQAWDSERRGMIESRGLAKPQPYNLLHEKSPQWPSVPAGPRAITSPQAGKEKYGVIGLGIGAIGAGIQGFSRAANRALSNPHKEYTALRDEASSPPGGISDTRPGSTIRLIGPRQMPPVPGRTMSPRLNMLESEDVRSFAAIPEESEPPSTKRRGGAARRTGELTRQDSGERYEDEQLMPPSLARIRGGPVPTPNDSTADLNPFADTEAEGEADTSFDIADLPSRDQHRPLSMLSSSSHTLPALSRSPPLDFAGFLTPRLQGESDMSLAHNYPSSIYSPSEFDGDFDGDGDADGDVHTDGDGHKDEEEAVVLRARAASATRAAILSSPRSSSSPETDIAISPPSGPYAPIKRTETFLRRMALGGIGGLLGKSESLLSRHSTPPIRDPADPPSLWPLGDRIDHGPIAPPRGSQELSSMDDDGDLERPPRLGRIFQDVSVTSLQSARSMRDLVIMQRHESGASSVESQAIVEQTTGSTGTANLDPRGVLLANETGASMSSTATPTPRKLRPVSVVSASPGSTHITPTIALARTDAPVPPAGSPLPAHLVSHRRPVKDMVFSINKRSSLVLTDMSPATAAILSPESEYSSGPSPRPATMYETARRSPLTIANPDASAGAGRNSSS